MISAAISGATTGDALTVVDPSTGEIGVAPNLAFNFMKENTMIYAKNGRLFAVDAAGNKTQISPHNDKGEWIYRSTDKEGVTTEINMIHLAELLEKVTGEKLIYKTASSSICNWFAGLIAPCKYDLTIVFVLSSTGPIDIMLTC